MKGEFGSHQWHIETWPDSNCRDRAGPQKRRLTGCAKWGHHHEATSITSWITSIEPAAGWPDAWLCYIHCSLSLNHIAGEHNTFTSFLNKNQPFLNCSPTLFLLLKLLLKLQFRLLWIPWLFKKWSYGSSLLKKFLSFNQHQTLHHTNWFKI